MRFLRMNQFKRIKDGWNRFRRGEEGPTALERMKALFEQEKVPYRLISHSEAYTAPHLAASIHAPGREVAKVVMVRANGDCAMVVLPSHRQIDFERFAKVAGVKRVSLVKEREMMKLFPGCEAGAMPPFGNLYGFSVFVEASLAQEPIIFFPAGSRHEVIEMRFEDFQRLARPRIGSFAMEALKRAEGF